MKTKHMVLSGLGVFVLWLFFWPSEKDHLNAQMAELCKIDGGVKIYERVKLPADAFNQWGGLKTPKSIKKGNEYVSQIADIYESSTEKANIKNGDPFKGEGSLARYLTKVVRVTDKKILAEYVSYSRAGGDRWFAGMPSAENCPISDGTSVFEKILYK
jgi:hypothetical protein